MPLPDKVKDRAIVWDQVLLENSRIAASSDSTFREVSNTKPLFLRTEWPDAKGRDPCSGRSRALRHQVL